MRMLLTGAAATVAVLAATIGTAVPAGAPDPFQVRYVTMNGTAGLAYYSHVSRSYRFISSEGEGSEPTRLSESARAR